MMTLPKLKQLWILRNIVGGDRDDHLTGNRFDNVLDGRRGHDSIYGGWGNDSIYGGWGNDAIYGGKGNDYVDGGYGYDLLDGGEGDDTASYAFYGGSTNANLETGIVYFPGNYYRGRTETIVNIENIVGGSGNDSFTGNDLNNVLDGGRGRDTMYGGLGSDSLHGGEHHDILIGTNAQGTSLNQTDTLTGGGGRDTFALAVSTGQEDILLYDEGNDKAIITDFTIGEDIVRLAGDASQYSFDTAKVESVYFVTLVFHSTSNSVNSVPEEIATFVFDAANENNRNLNLSDSTQFRFI